MIESPTALVIDKYSAGHRLILDFLETLTDAELSWQLPGGNQPIAWHAWHLARWADQLQACVPGMSPELGRKLGPCPQLWDVEGLAETWGLDSAQLGYQETGMYMTDALAVSMAFPPKTVLLDYVGRAFAQADRVIGAIDATQFVVVEQPQPLTDGIWGEGIIGNAVLDHVIHDYRHLGMMECLLGLQARSGTATR